MLSSLIKNKDDQLKRGMIFILSGPSGSGKTTLAQAILKDRKLNKWLGRSISFTTRPRRRGEKEGRDYFFISNEDFKWKLKKQKILEWTRYLGYYYGTDKDKVEQILKKGKNLILCLDIKGARKVKKLYPQNTITIFVMPPSLKELKKRIMARKRETKDEIKNRLFQAQKEITASKFYDYCLVNDKLRKAVQKLKQIILNQLRRQKDVSSSIGESFR
ncbi:MAG: guanylate kinase [Candidatus Omnitrophica bacterium]|nr:guanylate kinase [Candidatus Omnitrophota bacterium]